MHQSSAGNNRTGTIPDVPAIYESQSRSPLRMKHAIRISAEYHAVIWSIVCIFIWTILYQLSAIKKLGSLYFPKWSHRLKSGLITLNTDMTRPTNSRILLSKIPVLNSLNLSKFVTLRIFWTIGIDHMVTLIVTSITRKSDRDLVTDTCNNEMMQYCCNNIKLVIRLNNQMPRNMTFIWIYHCSRWKRAVFSKFMCRKIIFDWNSQYNLYSINTLIW